MSAKALLAAPRLIRKSPAVLAAGNKVQVPLKDAVIPVSPSQVWGPAAGIRQKPSFVLQVSSRPGHRAEGLTAASDVADLTS